MCSLRARSVPTEQSHEALTRLRRIADRVSGPRRHRSGAARAPGGTAPPLPHISFDRSMDCFIFIEKQGQNLVVIHLNRIPGLNNAPFVTFVPVEINVIVGSQVMKVPGE